MYSAASSSVLALFVLMWCVDVLLLFFVVSLNKSNSENRRAVLLIYIYIYIYTDERRQQLALLVIVDPTHLTIFIR